ncbi:MAG: CPBP family intramembrane metalloprotease [Bacteroidetes bacterium]|nr:CPBP family intramembrane metalloprotease [Bacteroidota bacterium]
MLKIKQDLKKELIESGIWTALLTFAFLSISRNKNSTSEIMTSIGHFILLYFIFFSLGREKIVEWMGSLVRFNIHRAVIFPTVLVVLYYSYIIIHGQNPLQGTVFMIPYLIYFPTLVFVAKKANSEKLDWLDFSVFILYLLPTTLVDFSPATDMPISGGVFDSVYRVVIMLAVVYAFVHVRGIKDVGFFPVFKLKFIWTTIWVWLAFYVFVFIIGYSVDFIKFGGHDAVFSPILVSIGISVLGIFLHTAIFEELFFRGLLQNMLTKRIAQSNSWESFWKWGGAILVILSLLAGFLMKGSMFWFPALVTILLFLAAYAIERFGKTEKGVYTALVITSVIFGLVHFHSGSIIFVGLASIGGWAYGYTYIKTKNVFYAALVHALVNSSQLIFGLEYMK